MNIVVLSVVLYIVSLKGLIYKKNMLLLQERISSAVIKSYLLITVLTYGFQRIPYLIYSGQEY